MWRRFVNWLQRGTAPTVKDAIADYRTRMANHELRLAERDRARLERLRAGEAVESFEWALKNAGPPDHARIGRLTSRLPLTALPRDLRCRELIAHGTQLVHVPDDLVVERRLDLSGGTRLTTLPAGLTVDVLRLNGCTALCALPRGVRCRFLALAGATALTALPDDLDVRDGHVTLSGCTALASLGGLRGPVATLDLSGCERLTALPDDLVVTSRLDIGGTGITALPPGCASARLAWSGVTIDHRIAFRPETISGAEVLAETNAERRRILLERVGFERFFSEVDAICLDEDTDAGGPRRLLRVPMDGDEDLVCVAVSCPSTARQYVLRVPPTVQTCHQAVAWTAGFDDPSAYRPAIET